MLYKDIKDSIQEMIDDINAGKEECQRFLSFNLIKGQDVPIVISADLIYSLNQIRISLYCPFLLVEPDIKFVEIIREDNIDDELRLMRLISKFTTILEKIKSWIETDVSDMIRWGEGVIFDKNGRTKKIPYVLNYIDK